MIEKIVKILFNFNSLIAELMDEKNTASVENNSGSEKKEAEKVVLTSKQELDALKKNIDDSKDDKEKFETMVDYVAGKILKLMVYEAMQIKEVVGESNSTMFEVLDFFGINPIESVISELLDDGAMSKVGLAFLRKKYTSSESIKLLDSIETIKGQLPTLTNLDACVKFAQKYDIPLPDGMLSKTSEQATGTSVETVSKNPFIAMSDELKAEKLSHSVMDYSKKQDKSSDISGLVGSGMLMDIEKSLGFLQKNFVPNNEISFKDLTNSISTNELTVGDWIITEKDGKKFIYLLVEKPKDGKVKVAGNDQLVDLSAVSYAGKVDYQKLQEKTS
ncbi:MAG TPA: hypothetical protein PKC14_00485 [Candidatus Absconditabacterales bacterium]|nr:hypothetical protein [Candidatus Absconditabacterales bacterium]